MAAGDMAGAARVAYSAPPDLLRNSETLNKIKMLQARPD